MILPQGLYVDFTHVATSTATDDVTN